MQPGTVSCKDKILIPRLYIIIRKTLSLLRRKRMRNRTDYPPSSVVAVLRVLALAIERGVTIVVHNVL